jgi:hypothetical protein
VIKRQVFDIPELNLEVTEHQVWVKEFEEEWEEHSILFQRNGEHCLNQLVGKDFQI